MSMLALVLMCIAGGIIVSGVWCLFVRAPSQKALLFSFGILTILVGVDLVLITKFLTTSTSMGQAHISLARYYLACLIYPCAVWFLGLYSRTPKLKLWVTGFGVLYLIALVLASVNSKWFIVPPPTTELAGTLLGQPIYQFTADPFMPLNYYIIALVLLLFAWAFWRGAELWRSGAVRKAAPLIIYLVFQFAMIMFDFIFAPHIPFIVVPLAPFGFLALLAIMGSSLFLDSRHRETEMSGTMRTLHHEIARRKDYQSRLATLSQQDLLQGAPSRQLFNNVLESAISAFQNNGQFGAVVVMKLDGLKHANEVLGHDAGDKLFTLASARLNLPEVHCLSWFGDDEYALILEDLGQDHAQAEAAAQWSAGSLRDKLNEPFNLEGAQLTLGASVGVAVFPSPLAEGKNDTQGLLRQADMALYRAKAACHGNTPALVERMQQDGRLRGLLETELRAALERDEIQRYFRPQIDTAGRLVGVEMRQYWNHPRYGRIKPHQFLLLAEEAGLLRRISEITLASICRQLHTWDLHSLPGLPRLSFNVSHGQLSDPGFVNLVRQSLASSGVDPGRLTVEVGEQAIIQNVDDITQTLRALNALGVRLAIDDFGAGYVELELLKRLPLKEAKLDRVFVAEANTAASEDFLGVLIRAAQSLGLYVVACGVETEQQRAILARLGCSAFQGDLFGAAVRELNLEKWAGSVPAVAAVSA